MKIENFSGLQDLDLERIGAREYDRARKRFKNSPPPLGRKSENNFYLRIANPLRGFDAKVLVLGLLDLENIDKVSANNKGRWFRCWPKNSSDRVETLAEMVEKDSIGINYFEAVFNSPQPKGSKTYGACLSFFRECGEHISHYLSIPPEHLSLIGLEPQEKGYAKAIWIPK